MYMEDHPLLPGENPESQSLFHYYRALRLLHGLKQRHGAVLFNAAFASCPAGFFTDFASEPATHDFPAVRGHTITMADIDVDPESRRPLVIDPVTHESRRYAGPMP